MKLYSRIIFIEFKIKIESLPFPFRFYYLIIFLLGLFKIIVSIESLWLCLLFFICYLIFTNKILEANDSL